MNNLTRCLYVVVLAMLQAAALEGYAPDANAGSSAAAAPAATPDLAATGADISGIWVRDSDPRADASSPGAAPPLKEPYAKSYKASRKNPAPPTPAGEKCKVEGMPTIMAAHNALEILQTPGQVTVLAEYMSQTRRIYLDEPLPAPDDVNPGYMGYSVAKWHGNTLEVQTVGVREDVRYLDIPHSAKMHISEKIHLAAPDRLQDDITIVDPVLTRPYSLTFTYKRDRQHRIMEYPCVHKGIAAAEPSPSVTPPRSK
jgi:hypothetical protein